MQHHAEPDGEHQRQINDKKRRPAIFPSHIGKLPNISQTDRGTGGGKNEAKPRSPTASVFRQPGSPASMPFEFPKYRSPPLARTNPEAMLRRDKPQIQGAW